MTAHPKVGVMDTPHTQHGRTYDSILHMPIIFWEDSTKATSELVFGKVVKQWRKGDGDQLYVPTFALTLREWGIQLQVVAKATAIPFEAIPMIND